MIVVERWIGADCAGVFRVLSDGWSYAGWVVGASAIREVDPGWPQPGSRIHHSVGSWPLLLNDTTRVVDADPPHRLVLQARAWPLGEARVSLELTTLGDGVCLVRMAEDASHGIGRYLPRGVRRMGLVPRNRESLRRLGYLTRRYT